MRVAGEGARASLLLLNEGPGDVFVGGPSVTTSNGMRVPAGGSLGLGSGDKASAEASADTWAVSSSSATVRVLAAAP